LAIRTINSFGENQKSVHSSRQRSELTNSQLSDGKREMAVFVAARREMQSNKNSALPGMLSGITPLQGLLKYSDLPEILNLR